MIDAMVAPERERFGRGTGQNKNAFSFAGSNVAGTV